MCTRSRWSQAASTHHHNPQQIIIHSTQKNNTHSPDAGLMLGQRRRRWPSIKPTSGKHLLFAGIFHRFLSCHSHGSGTCWSELKIPGKSRMLVRIKQNLMSIHVWETIKLCRFFKGMLDFLFNFVCWLTAILYILWCCEIGRLLIYMRQFKINESKILTIWLILKT